MLMEQNEGMWIHAFHEFFSIGLNIKSANWHWVRMKGCGFMPFMNSFVLV